MLETSQQLTALILFRPFLFIGNSIKVFVKCRPHNSRPAIVLYGVKLRCSLYWMGRCRGPLVIMEAVIKLITLTPVTNHETPESNIWWSLYIYELIGNIQHFKAPFFCCFVVLSVCSCHWIYLFSNNKLYWYLKDSLLNVSLL